MKQLLFIVIGWILLAIIGFFAWPELNYEPYKVSASYRNQVEAFNIPDMPEDWTWAFFASNDGMKMRYGQTGNAASAQATVVMIPGYTAQWT